MLFDWGLQTSLEAKLLCTQHSHNLTPTTTHIATRAHTNALCSFVRTPTRVQADTLCSRIGIITHGCLRVIGTQADLKARYGAG